MLPTLRVLAVRALPRTAVPCRPAPLGIIARLSSSTAHPIPPPAQLKAPVATSSVSPQRPTKHKAKKSKKPVPSTPALTVASLRPTTPSLPALLPLGLKSTTNPKDRAADGQAIALSSAERYDTTALLKGLQALNLLDGAVNLLGEAILLPRWSPAASDLTQLSATDEVGEVFIFESGTIVTWGLSLASTETFLRKVIRGGGVQTGGEDLGWVEQGRYTETETEVLEYWIGKRSTRMEGDSIHLSTTAHPPAGIAPISDSTGGASPNKDLLARLAFSAGMARVTKLGVYEEQLDEFAEKVAGIPKLLSQGSESPVKKTDIIKRVGELHGFRQKLNLEDENLLDEPEFLWEDARLHGYYTSVCQALEFDSRVRNLNDRVDYAFQLQSTLMELLNTKTSHRLEWIIILLIAFEISIVLLREGFALFGEDDEEKKVKPAH